MNRTLLVFLGVVVVLVQSAPLEELKNKNNINNWDQLIDEFLEKLYRQVNANQSTSEQVHQLDNPPRKSFDIYEQMQGDQPHHSNQSQDDDDGVNAGGADSDYLRAMRNRSKDNWIQALKENILRQIGRANATGSDPTLPKFTTPTNFNISAIPAFYNNVSGGGTPLDDDHIAEKIRSYYPSCDTPTNMDEELWSSDANSMNLYFAFDTIGSTDEKNIIATATLRLYRILAENATNTSSQKTPDCDQSASVSSAPSDEEKLVRVSIYWYQRSMKKKRIKKKLSDSKVIGESARWVELSVKPATRQWSRGRNLGLVVEVDDQDGNVLPADKLFKGANCMVGASTPKPIPTIIIDAARQSNKLDGINSLLGRNSTAAVPADVPMLPSIDICTLEFPENYSALMRQQQLGNLRVNACNLRKNHEQAQQLADRERFERLVTLPDFFKTNNNSHSNSNSNNQSRHIRHQRQHFKANSSSNEFDPRSKIQNKRILTNEELQALNLNITRIDR